jgi:hypothetical protein
MKGGTLMRYEQFDLQEWLANPNGMTVVWAAPDGNKKPLRDFAYLPTARTDRMFAAVVPSGNSYFFSASELAFELPDLPEEHAENPMNGLVSSDKLVSGIDSDNLSKVFSYSGLDGSTLQTANVGAWYHDAVYWKHKALNAQKSVIPLPEEECWVWEFPEEYGGKYYSEEVAMQAYGTPPPDWPLWHIRINRNDGTLRGDVVPKEKKNDI